jgi:hypothetical protein
MVMTWSVTGSAWPALLEQVVQQVQLAMACHALAASWLAATEVKFIHIVWLPCRIIVGIGLCMCCAFTQRPTDNLAQALYGCKADRSSMLLVCLTGGCTMMFQL